MRNHFIFGAAGINCEHSHFYSMEKKLLKDPNNCVFKFQIHKFYQFQHPKCLHRILNYIR